MIRNNPELLKNIRLEVTSIKIVVPLLLLSIITFLSVLNDPSSYELSRSISVTHYKAESLYYALVTMFFLFTIIWGGCLVASSVRKESEQRTWDFILLSPLPAFKLFTGKIFGAPSVMLGIAFSILLPLILVCANILIPEEVNQFSNKNIILTQLFVILCASALLSYSFPFLLLLNKNSNEAKEGTIFAFIMIVLFTIFIWKTGATSLATSFNTYQTSPKTQFSNSHPAFAEQLDKRPERCIALKSNPAFCIQAPDTESIFFGKKMSNLSFLTILIAFFAFWVSIGAYRTLKKFLRYKLYPVFWFFFVFSGTYFFSGFHPFRGAASQKINHPAYLFPQYNFYPLMFLIVCLIVTAFNESMNYRYSKLFSAIKDKNLSLGFKNMPLWSITLLILLFYLTYITIVVNRSDNLSNSLVLSISLLAFIIRDLLVLHSISLSSQIKRKLLGVILYIVIIWSLLPILVMNLFSYGSAQKLPGFYPALSASLTNPQYFFSIFVQLVIAGSFFLLVLKDEKLGRNL
jgi:ABC-type transport system involved in multi-copper enzyme maturation permease subunit